MTYKKQKPISEATIEALREYCRFLQFGLMKDGNVNSYEATRCKLHQAVFKSMHGDRIRNRNTAIGKRIDSWVCDVFSCRWCGHSIDRMDNCFNCRRPFKPADFLHSMCIVIDRIRLNNNKLLKKQKKHDLTLTN